MDNKPSKAVHLELNDAFEQAAEELLSSALKQATEELLSNALEQASDAIHLLESLRS